MPATSRVATTLSLCIKDDRTLSVICRGLTRLLSLQQCELLRHANVPLLKHWSWRARPCVAGGWPR